MIAAPHKDRYMLADIKAISWAKQRPGDKAIEAKMILGKSSCIQPAGYFTGRSHNRCVFIGALNFSNPNLAISFLQSDIFFLNILNFSTMPPKNTNEADQNKLTKDETEELIGHVRDRDALYNLAHKNYFRTDIQDNNWAEISSVMKKDGEWNLNISKCLIY